MTPSLFALVAAGGALGATLRYGVSLACRSGNEGSFPVGTLTVNLAGCLLIGVVAALLAEQDGRNPLRVFIIVGCLGGFTTFSSFGLETLRLLDESRLGAAAAYVLVSNVGGVVLCWLGLRGGSLFIR